MATALFTVAELRAFDQEQITEADYSEAVILAEEVAVREFLERACGVNFVPTAHTETHDGNGANFLFLDWVKVTDVTSITVDGVALTATEIDPDDYLEGLAINYNLGILTRRSGSFSKGFDNVTVVYTAGLADVPALIHKAALLVAVDNLVANNTPYDAESFSDGNVSYSLMRADGYNGNWHKIPDVQKAIRMYSFGAPRLG